MIDIFFENIDLYSNRYSIGIDPSIIDLHYRFAHRCFFICLSYRDRVSHRYLKHKIIPLEYELRNGSAVHKNVTCTVCKTSPLLGTRHYYQFRSS